MFKNDDTAYLQSLLDTRETKVYFPYKKEGYTISAPLRIYSNQSLCVDRFTVIRLAGESNCRMLQNDDWANGNCNVEVSGGIWDMNNLAQAKNPIHFPYPEREKGKGLGYNDNYFGTAIQFFNVKNLLVHDLTVKDPVTFAIQSAKIFNADFMNIIFDFNYGNPYPINMDGVHLDGDCRHVRISNLKGNAYDDLVALNADDCYCGPIENVVVDGIYVDEAHSAVRMLSTGSPVRNVTITNVFGRYYQYAVAFSKYFNEDTGETRDGVTDHGVFENITLSKLYISKAPRHSIYQKDGGFVYPLIWIENRTKVSGLHIRDLYRDESDTPIETIGVDPMGTVEDLIIDGVHQTNSTQTPITMLYNQGKIEGLEINRVRIGEDIVFKGDLDEIGKDI